MEHCSEKSAHKIQRQGITQKKEYNILSCNRRRRFSIIIIIIIYYYHHHHHHHNGMNQDNIKGNSSELHNFSESKFRIPVVHDSKRQQSRHLQHNTIKR
jgi:hypothetical protein